MNRHYNQNVPEIYMQCNKEKIALWHGVEHYKTDTSARKRSQDNFTPFKSMLEITNKIT